MDQLMYVVTFVALSLAIGMSVVAARLLRGNQQRSAARVAALEEAALIDDEFDDTPGDVPVDGGELQYDDFREDAPVASAMFTAANEAPAPKRRWLALATSMVVMALLIGGGYFLLRPAELDAAATSAAVPGVTRAAQAPPTTSPGAPLELLSLKHTSEADTFTITGLVQDPADGAALAHVTAVVYLFDADGAYFGSGRAALEFTGLRPGETSPFLVKIPVNTRVARYRVGFRREDGSVIAHVDRRGQPPAGMTSEAQ